MKPKPLSRKTTYVTDKTAPPPGPCGGTAIWMMRPFRHWCRMDEAEVAMHVLAGGEFVTDWPSQVSATQHEDAWVYGTMVIKRPDGRYEHVRLHSECRWAKNGEDDKSHG